MGDGSTVVGVASSLADWCDQRASEIRTQASRQFTLIVLIVVVGLCFILALPPVVALIDYWATKTFAGAPPVEALENAQEAIQRLDAQVADSQLRLEGLGDDLEALELQMDGYAAKRTEIIERAFSMTRAPLGIWWRQEITAEQSISLLSELATLPDGALLASGNVVGLEGETMVLLRGEDGQRWLSVAPKGADGSELGGSLGGVAFGSGNAMYAVGRSGEIRNTGTVLVLRSDNGIDWAVINPVDVNGQQVRGGLNDVVANSADVLVAVGRERVGDEDKILVLRSEDGRNWSAIRQEDSRHQMQRPSGTLTAVTSKEGTFFAVGRGTTLDSGVIIQRSEDGRTWSSHYPTSADGTLIGGRLAEVIVAADGAVIAVGYESSSEGDNILVLRSEDGKNWMPINILDAGKSIKGELSHVAATTEGQLIAVGRASGADAALILSSRDGLNWLPIRLEDSEGALVGGPLTAILVSGNVYVGGGQTIWRTSDQTSREEEWKALPRGEAWRDHPEHVTDALAGMIDLTSRDGFGYPQGTAALRQEGREAISRWNQSLETRGRVLALQYDSKEALARQSDTLAKVRAATEELGRALADSDELRRAGQIATRLAVVALLIYLVQIVVNRYRYLQRIEGFYRARAHALQLLAASPGKGAKMLLGVSVTDLMLALSPDAIGFDKSAEPPTQNMMSLFREAMRRDRPA